MENTNDYHNNIRIIHTIIPQLYKKKCDLRKTKKLVVHVTGKSKRN